MTALRMIILATVMLFGMFAMTLVIAMTDTEQHWSRYFVPLCALALVGVPISIGFGMGLL